MAVDVMDELFETNPYIGIETHGIAPDVQGWGSSKKIFEELIDSVRPKLIVEVGSWKGGSAINMGTLVKAKGLDCRILCVDTWLGSLEHWNQRRGGDRHHWYTSLKHRNGYPQLFYQFLTNVAHSGLADVVVPFPTTSDIAARWLKMRNIHPDLVYIDAGHEEDDVYADVSNYYDLLSDKGVLFGDDWGWQPDVPNAIRRFETRNYPLKAEVVEDSSMFVLRKRRSIRDVVRGVKRLVRN